MGFNSGSFSGGGSFGGGTTHESAEWQPSSDWPDIKSILENDDTQGYDGKYIQLITDHYTTISLTGALAYRTSDGILYGSDTIHTWDTTQDIPCSLGYKTRYVIYYTNETSAIIVQNTCLWTVLDLMLSSVATIASKYFLKAFEFINNKNISPTLASAASMFYNCYSLAKLPGILDLSNCTSTASMFYACYSLVKVPDILDLSNCSSTANMFYTCTSLVKAPDILDLSNCTSTASMFHACYSLVKAPDVLDLSNCISTANMFYACTSLVKAPDVISLSNCTSTAGMFQYCYSLVKAPDILDLSNCTNTANMFYNCYSLTKVPDILDLSNCTSMASMFQYCYSLTKVPDILDLSNCTDTENAFTSAPYIKNLRIMGLKVSANIAAIAVCTREDLVFILTNLQIVTGQTLTIGSTNVAKLSNDDKAIATEKGWTLA